MGARRHVKLGACMLDVDLAGLRSLRHECGGCLDPADCCCGRYDVCVSSRELPGLEGLLPQASKYCPHLRRGGGFDNALDRVGPGLYSIDTDEEGLCVFAYRSAQGVRCSLHSAALDLNIPITAGKPTDCLLWPLAITSGQAPILFVHPDAFSFPCNKPRSPRRPGLHAGVAQLVEQVFGSETRARIEQAADRGVQRTRVPLRGPLALGRAG